MIATKGALGIRVPELRGGGRNSVALASTPRIEQTRAGRFEVGSVPRHKGQSMNKGGRGHERVAFGARIGNVQARAALGDDSVNWKNPPSKFGNNQGSQPISEYLALFGVFAFKSQNADFKFQDRYG